MPGVRSSPRANCLAGNGNRGVFRRPNFEAEAETETEAEAEAEATKEPAGLAEA